MVPRSCFMTITNCDNNSCHTAVTFTYAISCLPGVGMGGGEARLLKLARDLLKTATAKKGL